jgi:anti-sigma B factor antagonist
VLHGTPDVRAVLADLRSQGVDFDARLDTLECRGDAVVASCTVRRHRPGGLEESQQHWVFHVVAGRLRRLSTYAGRDEAISSLAALHALAPATTFEVAERAAAGEHVVRPAGELDIATAPRLDRALLDGRRAGDVVVLDLADLEFMDSTGLRVIVRAVETARRDGWQLTLRPGRPAVQRIFDLAGVRDALPFETS